jgi:acyl carrier protein
VLAEITALLTSLTGLDRVTPASRLDGDLHLDSLELAAFGDRLSTAYGDRVDLIAFFATLDIDQLIALTVGDVAAYVAGARS